MSVPQLGPSPAQITLMGHNIAARIVAAKARRRRNARLAVATGGLAAAIAVTAAGIGVATAPPAVQATGYSCYTVDDPRGVYHVMPYPDDAEIPTGSERVQAAREMCVIAFGQHGVQTPDPAVCELPDLRLAVFPNAEGLEHDVFCRSLGLGPAPLG